ncbi:Chloroperoxidase [Plasmopara halstedii]|uniref:Chloroperoxidase n=1 Tax=Plasmopara halstedii TaxID=4781 RepID=A0A0P1AM57_PLAHL|nr:Chloroperoxidase [Plasmopara halstedii]CEG41992.1 Chloroperoxidase [Plasmopara halstedii]|eukprot:XP_024578361.1 Chloroperoxidase [Plasmopara halstedii]
MMSDDLVAVLLSNVPETISLNGLSAYGHQISLPRLPTYLGHDPAVVDVTLVENLLTQAKDGYLDAQGVGNSYKARINTYQSDPRFNLSESQLSQAFGEGSFLLLVFGGNRDDRISTEHTRSFLIEEKFPDNWVPSSTYVTLDQSRNVADQIRAVVV